MAAVVETTISLDRNDECREHQTEAKKLPSMDALSVRTDQTPGTCCTIDEHIGAKSQSNIYLYDI